MQRGPIVAAHAPIVGADPVTAVPVPRDVRAVFDQELNNALAVR